MRRLVTLVMKFLTVVSLVLCAIVVAEWVQSYDGGWGGFGGEALRVPFSRDYEIAFRNGRATLRRWDWPSMTSVPVASAPLWWCAAATIILPLVHVRGWRTDWQARRRDCGWRACLQCGYDLRESPTRCPECGTLAGMPPLPPASDPVEEELRARFEDAVTVGLGDLTPDALGPPVARFLAAIKAHPDARDYAERLIVAALAAPHAAERVLQLCLHELRWPAVRSDLKNRRVTERNAEDERLWGRLLDAFSDDWPVAAHYRAGMAAPTGEATFTSSAVSPAPRRSPRRR